MSFEEFLNVKTIQQIEAATGVKLKFFQKSLIRWWISMKKSNSHLDALTLFESIRKGRF